MAWDKELIHGAAKALGCKSFDFQTLGDSGDYAVTVDFGDGDENFYPLTNDSHAFRLLAELEINIDYDPLSKDVIVYKSGMNPVVMPYTDETKNSALRRAITELSHNIGEKQQ